MTAVVTESFRNRASVQSGDGVKFIHDGSRFFTVTFSSGEYTAESLKNATISGLPKVTDSHPNNIFIRATERLVELVSTIAANVEVTYGTTFGAPVSLDGNPLNAPADIEYGYDISEEDVELCGPNGDGEPVTGSGGALKHIAFKTGERPEPRIREPAYTGRLIIGKNLASVNQTFLSTLWGLVNDSQWYQFPAGTVLFKGSTARSIVTPDFQYVRLTAEFNIRRGAPFTTDQRAWWKRVAAQGWRVREAIAGTNPTQYKTVWARDKEGKQALRYHNKTTGVSLNYDATSDLCTENVQFYEFETKRSASFAGIGLP